WATRNQNARWPDVLARRLQGDKHTSDLGVLNLGIGGNRILHDNTGPSALARFDRDVIAQAGVKYCVILEGINDIGHAYDPAHPDMFLPAYDHGDHLHPGDAGYKAMGDAIDLALFTK